jgi:gamma-glutamyltranspeptidase/glutathione hydrolase
LFRKHWTTSAAVYLPNNEVPKPGTLFTNKSSPKPTPASRKKPRAPEATASRRSSARKTWSQGFVAEAIDNSAAPRTSWTSAAAASRRALGRRYGALAADRRGAADLRLWPPHRLQGRRLEPGSGDAAAACAAQGIRSRRAGSGGPEFIHLQIEAAKLAFADREKFYGDPKFTDIPIETLLSDAYNDERRKLISKDSASLDFIPGSVEGWSVVKLRRAEGHREAVGAMGAGEPTVGRFGEARGDTVHFDIIDQAGNMISATPSGGWLQSSPVIPSSASASAVARRCSG